MDRRLDVTVVGHLHGDLRSLIDVQSGAGDRAVVSEHPQLGARQALAHGLDRRHRSGWGYRGTVPQWLEEPPTDLESTMP